MNAPLRKTNAMIESTISASPVGQPKLFAVPPIVEREDNDAKSQAVEEHHDALYRWALALCKYDRDEAMEVVQQTYLEVMEGAVDLSSAKDERAFLFGVARRIRYSRVRRTSVWGRCVFCSQVIRVAWSSVSKTAR